MPAGRGRNEAKRGGKSRAGTKKISGVDFSWDPDLGIDTPAPSPLFPSYKPTLPKPLTNNEKAQVAHFLSLRASIHEGPFYSVLGDNVRIGKSSTTAAATFDPFEGMPTYSQRYIKRRRKIPKLDSRPYVLKFFPEELWSTLDPTCALRSCASAINLNQLPTKRLQLSKIKRFDELDHENISGDEDEGGERRQQQNPDDDEADMDEAELDDEFEEEDDEGGDYNAEQYFDDGADDAGDDYDAGDGDGDGGDYF